MTDPSDYVLGKLFRRKDAGVGTMSSNSHAATGDFFVDRSQLGVHEEYDPDVKNDWGGTGKYVEKPNSIMHNVRRSMGDIGACSSNKRRVDPNAPTNTPGNGCCAPSPYGHHHNHPVTGHRKNEE